MLQPSLAADGAHSLFRKPKMRVAIDTGSSAFAQRSAGPSSQQIRAVEREVEELRRTPEGLRRLDARVRLIAARLDAIGRSGPIAKVDWNVIRAAAELLGYIRGARVSSLDLAEAIAIGEWLHRP
jgi:hypothetical protein